MRLIRHFFQEMVEGGRLHVIRNLGASYLQLDESNRSILRDANQLSQIIISDHNLNVTVARICEVVSLFLSQLEVNPELDINEFAAMTAATDETSSQVLDALAVGLRQTQSSF